MWVAVCRETWVWMMNLAQSQPPCTWSAAPWPFCMALEPVIVLTLALLYCCTLFNFIFLDFVSCNLALKDLTLLQAQHEHLASTVLEHLESASEQDLGHWATCAGLEHGHDYSCCIASEQKCLKNLAIAFPWIVKNIWKTMAHCEGFSTLTPQTGSYSKAIPKFSMVISQNFQW